MRSKAAIAAALALFVGSCSCLMPLAAAFSKQDHSCCPAPASADDSPDCCLRGAAPSAGAVLAAPQFTLIGLAHPAPRAGATARHALRLGSAALSPPGLLTLAGRSSRAPPSLPA